MIIQDQKHVQHALKHGVDSSRVIPLTKGQRLEQLRAVLQRQDVPYPIDREIAETYMALAMSGEPFKVGSLSDQTIELGEFANAQEYDSLSIEDHLSWACLIADQQATKHRYACREYLHGEEMFEICGSIIPDYYILNARIYQQTQWQLATVNMIIPAHAFFSCHSRRFFPVTTFMRPLGTDYLPEPDIGHDIAGHVATFTIPQVALVMNNHGLANDLIHQENDLKLQLATSDQEIERIKADTVERLLYAGRLYWFTVEFGLVMQGDQLKAFGAGILSSPGETAYSIDSPDSNRVLIDPKRDEDLLRLATTDYLISEYQKTYFVMNDFDSLRTLTPSRIVSIVNMAQRLPHHTWRELVPGDHVINVGRSMTSANEKYFRLLGGQELDDCLRRAAIRNMRMTLHGFEPKSALEREFLDQMSGIPQTLLREFSLADQSGRFQDTASGTTQDS